jgi:LysR family transcriptional regulator, transcriptional activator of the cysJI operon
VLMNFSHLKLFKAVADALSLTKVSGELHTSQSSISHQLRILQEQCGVRLYSKAIGGIELTKEGRLFLRESEKILFHVEALESKLRAAATTKTPRPLKVAASYGPSEVTIPTLLAVLKKHHPKTEVIFRTTDSWSITRLLIAREFEIALVNNVIRSPQLIVEHFSDEEIVAITSVHSPFANNSKITVREFASLPLVVREGKHDPNQLGSSFYKLKKMGLNPNIVMRCGSFAAVKSAVENGIGVGLLSRDHLNSVGSPRTLKVLKIPELQMKLERVIVYRKDGSLSPIATEFLELIRRSRKASTRSV